jgi:hypothetical protein
MFLNYYSQNSLKNTILGVLNEVYDPNKPFDLEKFVGSVHTTRHEQHTISSAPTGDGLNVSVVGPSWLQPGDTATRGAITIPYKDYPELFRLKGDATPHVPPNVLYKYLPKEGGLPTTPLNIVEKMAVHLTGLGPNAFKHLLPPERR